MVLIGIAGGSGSGKTTLAKAIQRDFPSTIILPMDAYYKDIREIPETEGHYMNFDVPEAYDLDLFYNHVMALACGASIQSPIYDYKTHTRSRRTRTVVPASILVSEGILLFSVPMIRSLFDLLIAVDVPLDLQIERRIRRDTKDRGRSIASCREQLTETVIPMFHKYVQPSLGFARITIPGDVRFDCSETLYKNVYNTIAPLVAIDSRALTGRIDFPVQTI